MTLETAIAFSIGMTILAFTPGPGVKAVTGRAIQCGLAQSALVIAGLVLADVALLTGAAYAMSALAAHLGDQFIIVRIFCALYLIYLGRQTLLDAASPFRFRRDPKPIQPSYLRSLVLGLRVQLGNPRMAIFYLVLVPAFLNLKAMAAADIAVMNGIAVLAASSVLGIYALKASQVTQSDVEPEAQDAVKRKPAMLLFGSPFSAQAKMR